MKPHVLLPLCLAGISLVFSATTNAEAEWRQFRGPTGRGHTADKDVPVKWSPQNVAWKVALKGAGQSSPVNAGDRIFLTGASSDGRERHVFCLNRADGKLLWEHTLPCAAPEKTHRMNGYATPTCATDGERVVAFFGPGGMHCFDLNGKKLWSRQLGDFAGVWGVGASPIIVGDKVIQNCDAAGASSLVALEVRTGAPAWQTRRDPKPRGGWSTPIVIAAGERRELVVNGEAGVNGYDPATGRELWFCKAFAGRGTPVPDFAHGLLYVVSGQPGDAYAVTPGGEGDVTTSRMKWHAKRRGGRDLPSPAVVGEFMFVVSMSGIGTCYSTDTGEQLWSDRLPLKGEYAAAPLVANGLIYFTTVNGGETIVVKPGRTPEFVAQNSLGADSKEIFRASLAPIGGRLYARSASALYCLRP